MANRVEQIGVNHCGEIAERMNWIFRIQPIGDVGIDAHMEYMEESGKAKQLLALQIKSGASWFKKKSGDSIVFRKINERQYNYWTTNTLPCIVVLYNPEDNMCIWQKLSSETIEKTRKGKGKGYFVRVPLNQVFLDDKSNEVLLSYTNLPEHLRNYNFLLSQKEYMQIIQDGGTVKLHSEEWVNKSSGRGNIKLIVNDGKCRKEYIYPYWFPHTSYTMVFRNLFPWAEFSVDLDFIEENDMALWRQLHCYFDKDEKEWITVGDSFEEFREKLDPLRSIDHAGEVAEYMLQLSLNELGKSFLNVDKYVSRNRPYVDARPKEEKSKKGI